MKEHEEDRTPVWKKAVKKITSPRTRDCIKRIAFRGFTCFHQRREKQRLRAPFGVNLIGHIRGDFGLGESCRIVAGMLRASNVPFSVYNLPQNGSAGESNMTWRDQERSNLPYSVNLVHLNPNEIANAVWRLDRKRLTAGYNIAFWLWELPEFPREWNYTFQLFDEIWTPAEFVSDSICRCTEKPVYTMPYGFAEPATDAAYDRRYFGLPQEPFLFLLSYDGNSVSERKNPLGAVRAYCAAFQKTERNVGIVIKATHAQARDLQEIRKYLDGYPHVYVLAQSYSKEEFNSLIKCVDAYVSLHRAEGFGLVMAEAMLLGTPVIATAWSANMEFMNENTACLVDADVVEIEREIPPYHKGNHWAQPDEHQAAQWMRRLRDDQDFAAALAGRAQEHMRKHMTYERAGQRVRERLVQLESMLKDE